MLVVIAREAEKQGTGGASRSGPNALSGASKSRRFSRASYVPLAAAAMLLVLLIAVSLAILVNLYNSNDQVGLRANPTSVPRATQMPASFTAPPAVPLTATAVLAGGPAATARLGTPQDAVRTADGRVFVADTGNHRIAILDRHGKYIGAITRGASGPLQTPYSLALTSDGLLVALDSDAGEVLEYNLAGKLLHASDPAALSLGHARGIALDPTGRVLVADPASNAVATLGPDLSLIHQQPASVAGKPDLFNQPSAVSVGADGTIFVVDSQNSRVEQFTSDWQLLKAWSIAVTDTQHSPRVASLSGGRLLVSDPRDNTLLLFGPDGDLPKAYSVAGPDGPESMPLGIDIERNGRVLVTFAASNHVVEIRLPGG
jgi:DNA-binding beta-propeller fold protein YncE